MWSIVLTEVLMILKMILHFSLSNSDSSENLRNLIIKIYGFFWWYDRNLKHFVFLDTLRFTLIDLCNCIIYYLIARKSIQQWRRFYRNKQILQMIQKLPPVSSIWAYIRLINLNYRGSNVKYSNYTMFPAVSYFIIFDLPWGPKCMWSLRIIEDLSGHQAFSLIC